MGHVVRSVCAILISVSQCLSVDMTSERPVIPELRVAASGDVVFICRALNESSRAAIAQDSADLFVNNNSLSYILLNEQWPTEWSPGLNVSHIKPPPPLIINPNEMYLRAIYYEDVDRWFNLFRGSSRALNRYMKLGWGLGVFGASNQVHIAFTDAQGAIEPPVVDLRVNDRETAKDILAMAVIIRPGLLLPRNHREIAFLVINSADHDIAALGGTPGGSVLIASSPSIQYRRELAIPDDGPHVFSVTPGDVGEWRLSLQTVLNLIPEDDMERIKAAGGDLDLIWKVGDLQSIALPLTLVVPEITESDEKSDSTEP